MFAISYAMHNSFRIQLADNEQFTDIFYRVLQQIESDKKYCSLFFFFKIDFDFLIKMFMNK